MARVSLSSPIVLAAALALAACHPRAPEPPEPPATAAEAAPADAGEMTREQAIDLIRDQAKSGAIKATVNRHYTQTVSRTVTCSPQEVEADESAMPHNPELWHCKGNGTSFSKHVTETVDACCKTDRVPLPESTIWNASYSSADDRWHVTADFGLEGAQHHAEWTVDKQSHAIGEVPGAS